MISTAENAHAQAQSHLVHVHQPEKGGGRDTCLHDINIIPWPGPSIYTRQLQYKGKGK